MAYFIYRIYFLLTFVIHYISPILLLYRVYKGKEISSRFMEKLGYYNIKSLGNLVWIHAASVGELNSVSSIIHSISKTHNVLVTTVTVTSEKVFKKHNFSSNVVHQFAPLDTPQTVTSFVKHWKPKIGVFVDSEIWPNLITYSSCSFKLININARLSKTSFKKWCYLKPLARMMYNSFSFIAPCSKHDMDRIKTFLFPKTKIEFLGNLKLSLPELQCDETELKKFQNSLKESTVIVAASTHKGEEDIIIRAFKKIKAKHIKLIIIPRHPNRGREVLQLAQDYGFKASIRTIEDNINDETDIYIANTLNELGLWYRLSDITIMGGFFKKNVGGHNIIEPAQLNNFILVGPHDHNFSNLVELFELDGAIVRTSEKTLHDDIKPYISSSEARKNVVLQCKKVLQKNDIDAQQILIKINNLSK